MNETSTKNKETATLLNWTNISWQTALLKRPTKIWNKSWDLPKDRSSNSSKTSTLWTKKVTFRVVKSVLTELPKRKTTTWLKIYKIEIRFSQIQFIIWNWILMKPTGESKIWPITKKKDFKSCNFSRTKMKASMRRSMNIKGQMKNLIISVSNSNEKLRNSKEQLKNI